MIVEPSLRSVSYRDKMTALHQIIPFLLVRHWNYPGLYGAEWSLMQLAHSHQEHYKNYSRAARSGRADTPYGTNFAYHQRALKERLTGHYLRRPTVHSRESKRQKQALHSFTKVTWAPFARCPISACS